MKGKEEEGWRGKRELKETNARNGPWHGGAQLVHTHVQK